MLNILCRLSKVLALTVLFSGCTVLHSQAAAVLGKIRFFDDNKILPAAYRLGLEHDPTNAMHVCLSGLDRSLGLANLRAGLEWKPARFFTARLGYKSDMPQGLAPVAGIGAVLKFKLKGGEDISYAVLPLAQHGASHFLSLTTRFQIKPRF